MRESNSHQRFWRPLSYHLTNPLNIMFFKEKVHKYSVLKSIFIFSCTFRTPHRDDFHLPPIFNLHLLHVFSCLLFMPSSSCLRQWIPVFSLNHPNLSRSSFLRISPRPISIRQLNALLHLHPGPIYLVVFKGSYFFMNGISYLEGGFTLRCLQRLSLPDLATLPCIW